ncbi:urease accessory protein UreD [Mycolicibacterium sp. Dal123E01]|uniref:urease accessory protein UreD n=1 Tax=Mycolicibacterium sp. Dal123E01 TaxID=3457578 RepID=UPI00403E4DD3
MTTATPIRAGELGLRVTSGGTNQTRIADLRQRYPQRVTSALHCDPDYPDAAVVCVQNPSGGAFSDDELVTSIDAGPGTHLRLTTQAATQVFAGAGTGARHGLDFRLHPGAVVQYLPQTLIPHRGSSYTQRLSITMAPTATYLGWDVLAAGRIGHGERFAFDCVDNAVQVTVGGRTAVRDRQLMTAAAARLIGADYLATLLMLAPWADTGTLLGAVRRVLALTDVSAGASELPGGVGVIVRTTTDRAPLLAQFQEQLLRTARGILIRERNGDRAR